MLNEEKIIIIKPSRSGGGGQGIHRIEVNEDGYRFDAQLITRQELQSKLEKLHDYIGVQFIKQAEYAANIFPDTTNSIRIVTGILKDHGPAVLLAFQRFGSKTTGAVDNISSGGVFTYIDENGVLSSGRSLIDPTVEYEVHPDTGAQIAGCVVPGWESICKTLLDAQKKFPYLKFLAWDVVIDENNKPYILEINRGCDLYVQMIKPLRNELLGRFMRENGMLSPRVDK